MKNYKKVEINGLICKIAKEEPVYGEHPKYSIISGGMSDTPKDYEDYLESFTEKTIPYLNLVKLFIEENDLIGVCADEFADDNTFEFSDGVFISFTWRAWGDLMATIVGKGESYMQYYMR